MARNVTTNVGVNVKATGAKRAASDVSAVGAALNKLGGAANVTNDRTVTLTRSTTRLGQASASTGRQFSAQASGLGGLVGAYAGAAATIFALQQAFSALNRSAQAETIINGTQRLAAQIGESGNKIISSLQAITEGQLTMVEAAEKANLALASGFNTEQIERLTQVSLKASRALGRNLNEAFERLVRGSAKLEPELLDELGIFTRLDPAVEAYAKQIGKASKDLTQFERRQAFVNAVIEEGERKFSAIDTAAPSAQKSLEQLSTTITELGTKFGILLANALVPVANFFTEDLAASISIFSLVLRQVTAVGIGMLGEAANKAGNDLNNWATTLLSSAASTDKAQASINAMNSALTELGQENRVYARGSIQQVNAANAMFEQMREGNLTVTQISEAQKVLTTQLKATEFAISNAEAELARLTAEGKQNTRIFKQNQNTLRQARADLSQYELALDAVVAGQQAQTKATIAGTTALRAFNVVARVTSTIITGLFRALNIFLLLASFGPILLKIAGQVEVLNNVIENVTRAFNEFKTANDAIETGVRTIANDGNIDKITEKFVTLGVAADQAAKNQENAIQILNDLAKNAIAPGILESALNVIPGFGTALKEMLSGTPSEDNVNLQILEELDTKIKDLRDTLLTTDLNPAEALNIRQTLDSLESMRDAFGDTNFRVREFAGILASLTGMTAANVLDTLTESSDKLEISINGVVVATRDNLGRAFSIANQNAAELITQFVGFSAVVSNANEAISTIGTPAKELIAVGQQLTNSQLNLNNVIEDTKERIADYYEIIRQEDANAREAFARGDRAAARAAISRSVLATIERDRLVETFRGVSANVRREQERLETIKKITDELAKQEILYDEVLKRFSSQISAFKDLEFTGEFNFDSNGISIAANEFERVNNQLTALKNQTAEFAATSQESFDDLGARLQAELGQEALGGKIKLLSGEIVDGFDSAKESVVEFIERIKGAEIANISLAGEVAKVAQNAQLLRAQAEAILGTFIQQLPALRALAIEAEKFARQLAVNQLAAVGENRISVIQEELKFTQTIGRLKNEEVDLERRLIQARRNTAKIQREGAIEQLRAQDQLLEGQKEQLQIQKEIAELKLSAAQSDKEAAKSLLEIGKSGIEASSLFGSDAKEFLGIIADLGAMNLDIGIAEDELKKNELNIANVDAIAAIEQQSIENRRQIAALEHQNRLDALQQEIENIEYQFEKDMEVLAERARQVDAEREILQIRKNIADAQRALAEQTLREEIAAMRDRVSDANSLVEGMETFIRDYSAQNTTFIQNLSTTQQALIDALYSAANTIAGAAQQAAVQASQSASTAVIQGNEIRYNNNRSSAPIGYGIGEVDPQLARAVAAVNSNPLSVTVENSNDLAVEFIKGFEGFSTTAYPDERQYSIGYGTRASSPNEVITREEALTRFSSELGRFTNAVEDINSKYEYNWNESQKAALTSFAYNLGEGALDTLTAQGSRTNEQIANAMLLYYNVQSDDQRKEAALADRRRQEQALFLSDLTTVSNDLVDRISTPPSTSVGVATSLAERELELESLSQAVENNNEVIRAGQETIYGLQVAALDAEEASLLRQGALRTAINEEEKAGAQASLDNLRAAGQASQAYWAQEARNASDRAEANKAIAEEEARQQERQIKLLKLREAQATFQGLSKFGGFLEAITIDRAQESVIAAEDEYNRAIERRASELEKLKNVREKESDTLTRNIELLNNRRELEQKYIETVGLGVEGASAYYELQKEYLDNINQAAAQSVDYNSLNRERIAQSIQLTLAEVEVAQATRARTEAENKLNSGLTKTIGSLGSFIKELGEFGNTLISISSLVSGLTSASGQGGIFGNILSGFGLDFKSLKNLPKAISDAISLPFQINSRATEEAIDKTAESAKSISSTVSGLSGIAEVIGQGISAGVASIGIAQRVGILGAEPTMVERIGSTLGGVVGRYVGGLVASAISGSAFGSALGLVLGPLGGLLGGLLGGFLGNLFSPTKRSGGVLDFSTGSVSGFGEKGGELTPLANTAKSLNDIVEDIIGVSTRADRFEALFASKGSKVRQRELRITVDGQAFTKGIAEDGEQLGKDIFELILKGFSSVGNADIEDAIKRLNFGDSVEENLSKIEFAAAFRNIIDNLGTRLTGSFISIAEEVEIIAAEAAKNLDQITGGLLSNYRELRQRATEVFGDLSSQVKELDDNVQNALLSIAGISVSDTGVVSLITRASETLNNMALIFAQTEGEMLGFKDALVETGMSAAEADRILRDAAGLKLEKIADEFYNALERANEVAKGLDPSIYENVEEIFNYQRDIIRDAQTIQDRFPAKFSDAVTKAEELALIQRLRLIAEGNDEQLKAIRLLTNVTGDFADATVQAAVQAEIASRTLLKAFDVSELQKTARRSEARLSFNYASVGFAAGGVVTGSTAQQNKDSVPAMLMPGEFVLNKESAARIGYDTLYALNSGNFVQMAAGGAVQTGLLGGTTPTAGNSAAFAAYEFDNDTSFISFVEAANILTDANEDLYDSYLNIFKSINSNLVPALEFVQNQLAEGNILQARAVFEYTTNIRDAASSTEALNQIVAEARTKESLRAAGLIESIDEIDNFIKASDAFFLAIQQPQDYLVQSQGLYKKLYTATNELNKLLAQGAISTDEYNSAIDSLNSAYNDSIELVKEYNDFFIELNDSLDATGALTAVRNTVDLYVDSLDRINYAVEDGVINTRDASDKTIQLNKLFNQRRLELVQNATEAQLKVLRDATNTAEAYAGGVATIVDFTYQVGAAVELVSRQLQAASESFSRFEVSLVDFYNSALQTSTGFGSRLTKSVESIFLEAGIEFDDALGTFYGSVGTFAVAAQQGLIGLGNLEKAINELNYQLIDSEEIDIETYQIGISILQSSFMDFINTFQDMRTALDTTKDEMETFRSSLLSSFNSIQEDITSLVEGMVSNYRSNFENLKGLFDSATSQQANAEEELYNTLFDAQRAFSTAGGNLSKHVDRINDIVSGLDPAYTGYAGLDQYLTDLRTDILAGTADLGNIDVKVPLSTLRDNLTSELANLTALQALPDSADKFVKISRALSRITDLENQIASSTGAVDSLKEAALQLVDVEKELNLNNTTAGLTGVDLTLTSIQEDLLQRAIDARTAYNDANAILDGYNAALATNTTFVQGLADVLPSVNDTISLFTNKLADVSNEFTDVQAAIAAVSAAGLTDALSNIVFDTDAYNIDVQSFFDSNNALAELTTTLSEYQNILDAKNAYESLYGALDTTVNVIPLDEFNNLNTELTALEANLLAVAKNIDPTITSLDNLDTVFKSFITDAISLLESPIQLDIVEPTISSTTAPYTVATTPASGSLGFGASGSNAILQRILTDGLGVRSPGYLYYIMIYLEDIRELMAELLLVTGGYTLALTEVTSPTIPASSTNTSMTFTGGTVFAGPDLSNLSGLTGQLFSVTEPIAMPADYFYIVVPQVIGFKDLLQLSEIEQTLLDFINIVKEDHTLDMWVNIDRQYMDYRTWFDQPTPLPTNYLKWFIPIQENTTWGAWFAPPQLTETGFADWFTWPPTTKWDTDGYDWFNITPKDIRYIDFFNPSETLNINEFIKPMDITANELYNINSVATTWDKWFYIAPLARLTFDSFFEGIDKGTTAFSDWFSISDPLIVSPNKLYVLDEPIEKLASSFYILIPEEITGSEVYELTGPKLVGADELIKINDLSKITVYYTDVFETDTVKLQLTDMFSNYDVNGGFEFVKATIDIGQVFDIDRFDQYGFANKIALSADKIFEGVSNDGVWELAEEDKLRVNGATFFDFSQKLDRPFETFFKSEKLPTDFYMWFDTPSKINIANIFEVFQPIPLDLINVFDLSNSREPIAPSQVFDISPNPTVLQASQVFDIGVKYTVNGNEVFNFTPAKILASEVVDFSHIKANPYLLVAADVLDVVNKLELDFNDYVSISSKAVYAAKDVISIAESTFYGADILNIVPTEYESEELFTVFSTALPGSSFYAISNPTALPAASFIGVDQDNKIQYTFTDVFAPLQSKLGIKDLFDNFSAGGFDWVKYTLAVEDVLDLTVLTTSGLRDKVVLSVTDLVANYNGETFELTNKGNIDYNSLFNPVTKLFSDFFTWFNPIQKLKTNFSEWFFMNETSKLNLNELVDNSVPLNYNDVFNFSNSTKIKPLSWGEALFFDEASKIKVRAAGAFQLEASIYQASQFIEFDEWKVTVSDLLDADYVRSNPAKFKGSEVITISEPVSKSVSELLNIVEKIDVDVNSLVNPVPSDIEGSKLFSPTVSSLSGNKFFKPTQFALTGAAFFTPIAASIDANDLFIISEKVPIDVTATFESDFMKMVTAITTLQATAIPFLKRMDDNLKSQPTDSAVALYEQIWDYYQNTFLKGYYAQWTPKIAKLSDIAMSVAATTEVVKVSRDLLETYLPSLDTNIKDNLSQNTDINNKMTTANDLLTQIRDQLPDTTVFSDIKGLLESIDLILFGIRVGTDYIDDVEKVLRESIYLRGFTDLVEATENLGPLITGDNSKLDTSNNWLSAIETTANAIESSNSSIDSKLNTLIAINKYRYIYSGASAVTVPGFKTGGLVEGPGTSTSDSIPAKLSKGEFVLTASTVSKLGTDFLNVLNQTGSIGNALKSFGIKGDTQVAHINDAEASLLKALGGSGSQNTTTGLRQFFFDGRPSQASADAIKTIEDSKTNYSRLFNINQDGYPQWLFGNNSSSYTWGYNANPEVGHSVSGLIRSASYAKGNGLRYEHKNWHRISDYYWGSISSNPSNLSEFGYDWNNWNNSIDANSWIGNPSSLQGTYGRNDWSTLANRIWSTWGVSSNSITPEGRALAQQQGIPGFRDGGFISGAGSNISDSMLARLSDGEYVFRNSSVDNLGVPTLDYMNRTGELPKGDTNVEINITNNGQPVDVEGEPQIRFDGEKLVVDVVLKDLRTNGPIRRTLKKIK